MTNEVVRQYVDRQYADQHVLVLGLGESGLAMARWLQNSGARVRIADTRAVPERLQELQKLQVEGEKNQSVSSFTFIGGEFTESLLDDIDLVAISPGLSPLAEASIVIAAASERNIQVVGEIELFARALSGLSRERDYRPKLIAITGTNGKTTVTQLTALLCRRGGLKTEVAGNISPCALDVLREALEYDRLPEVWVLELSSFQLHFAHSLVPDAATLLNLTEDHLDWHGDMEGYVQDKMRIFGVGTVRVINRDDRLVMKSAMPADTNVPVVTFGADEPLLLDGFGLVTVNGMSWLSLAQLADNETPKRKKKGDMSLASVVTTRLMPADALKIRGVHNAVNALAALALCRAIGLPLAPLLYGLRDYTGEPHRVELVATIDDVVYYDDSKGTNVGATVAALNGLGNQAGLAEGINSRRIWLIAGGEGKGQDFSPLIEPVKKHAQTVLLIGRDAPIIRATLEKTVGEMRAELIDCATLESAVEHAASQARAGDIVLLSPACASFDMFSGYGHRAQVYIDAVREIALSRGEVIA